MVLIPNIPETTSNSGQLRLKLAKACSGRLDPLMTRYDPDVWSGRALQGIFLSTW